ncbi:hypothetical protein Rhe02_54790 [Rhizocola hellebori]|uniref:Uncharacterized protein n=1 Tax=Rhizocola hellebori TaxID=1392758 RepID=A0A8J3QCD3_9ACTN|nr:hypothetical protein [Rhizocola hellebori]GIH07412.1 hypothetical protein Rhe02_54790 [Rhizocola hellebori]
MRRELLGIQADRGHGGYVEFVDGVGTYAGATAQVFAALRKIVGDDKLASGLIDRGWSNGYLYLGPATDAKSLKRTYVRDGEGQFADVPGVGNDAIALDKLKLASRIQLGEGERLLSSRKFKAGGAGSWDLLAAEVDTPNGREVRLGVVNPNDSKRWAGGADPKRDTRVREIDAEIERLEGKDDADFTDEDDARRDELLEERASLIGDADEAGLNRTALLGPAAVAQLRDAIAVGQKAASKHSREADAFWSEHGDAWAAERDRLNQMTWGQLTDADKDRLLELDELLEAAPDWEATHAEGAIPASGDGDLVYSIEGGDFNDDEGWILRIGVRPRDADENWYPGFSDDAAIFEPKDVKALLAGLAELAGDQTKAATGGRLSIKRTYVRDDEGQFAETPGGGLSALDKLKLGKLAPDGFTVRSSKKITTDYADLGVAEVGSPDGRQFRVGLITTDSGRWDAGFTGEKRKDELRQQIAQLQALLDSDDEQPDELEEKLGELESELEDLDADRTAILTPEAMADLRRQLGDAAELAKANKAKQNATVKELEALDRQRDDIIAQVSNPGLERQISSLSYRLRQKQGIIKRLSAKPNAHGWSDEVIAELLVEHRADAAELEAELVPLLARRAEIVPPEALARLEDLDRQYNTLNDADIDDIITSAEVPTSNGGRVLTEVWGSDDEDSDWVTARLYVLGPGETTHDADNSDEYAYLRGLKGLSKLIAAFDGGDVKAAAGRHSIKRSSTGETMQLKSFQPEVKAVGRNGDTGTATIAIATLGVVDKDGDVTQPGFFGEQHAQMVPAHDWNHVPIGKGRVYEKGNQALFDVTFNLKIPAAKDWYEAIKFDKENPPSLQEFSYGYHVHDGGSKQGNFKGRQVRYLTPRPDGQPGGKVFEVSPVLLGAGEGTGTVDVKSLARERIAARKARTGALGLYAGAVAPHETATVARSWDGVKTVAGLPDDALPSHLRTVYAWVDPAGDPELKASYKFPHHHGVSGPANIRACLAGIAVLNGATGGVDLTDADRKSVYDHLAGHLRDADREPPNLRTDLGVASGKNLRFGDEAANVLAGVAGLIDRASDVMALRQRKGKGLTANTADLLSWVRDECKRLDSLLSQPIEADDEPSTHVTDEEIASVVLAAVARLNDN